MRNLLNHAKRGSCLCNASCQFCQAILGDFPITPPVLGLRAESWASSQLSYFDKRIL